VAADYLGDTLRLSFRCCISCVGRHDLIADALPFGWLWYLEVADAIDYALLRFT